MAKAVSSGPVELCSAAINPVACEGPHHQIGAGGSLIYQYSSDAHAISLLPRDVGVLIDDVGRPVLAWTEDGAVVFTRGQP